MKLLKNTTKFTIISFLAIIICTVPVKAATYTVKQDGSGNFTSITQGVASVPNGSTLMIYPGVYNEHVDIINKTVNLIGTDRNTCILQYETSRYAKVPLNFSTGTISNLTIKGYNSGAAAPAPLPIVSPVSSSTRAPGEPLSQAEFDAYVASVRGQSASAPSAAVSPAPSTNSHVPGQPLSQAEIDAYVAYVRGQSSSPVPAAVTAAPQAMIPAAPQVTPVNATGYAIHLDQDYIFGKSAIIKDCNIISEHASCIGMGLRGGASVTITGCNFTSRSQGIVFFHDTGNLGLSGNASLNFTGNTMNSNGSFFIMTTALSPACRVNLTFNSNTVLGTTNCLIANLYPGEGLGWMGLNNYFLSANSVGNNVAFLNRQ